MISDITEFYKTLEKIPSHILEVVLLSRLEGRTDDEIARDNDFAESVLSVTKNDQESDNKPQKASIISDVKKEEMNDQGY